MEQTGVQHHMGRMNLTAGAGHRRASKNHRARRAGVLVVTMAVGTALVASAALTPILGAAQEPERGEGATYNTAITPAEMPAVGSQVFAKRYTNSKYRSHAKAKAKRYGLSIHWVNGNACRTIVNSVGCYTSGSTRITLSTRLKYQPKANVEFVVAHEASHHKIFRKCGTPRPPIVGKRAENVTDAYAAKVLKVRGASGYGYKASDVTIAKKISGGKCWSKQKTVKATSTGLTFYKVLSAKNLYTLRDGARLALLGKTGSWYIVRDSKGRVGYADPLAWKKPQKAITVKRNSAWLWIYGSDSGRWMKTGEKFGYLGSYDKNYYAARSSTHRLVLVAKKGF